MQVVSYECKLPTSRHSVEPRSPLLIVQVVSYVERLSFGATNCALPMEWAMQERLEFDGVCVTVCVTVCV